MIAGEQLRTAGLRRRRRGRLVAGSAVDRAAFGFAAVMTGVTAYRLAILAAAARAARTPRLREPGSTGRSRFIIVIPAHNEESVLPATLASIKALDYPRELMHVVVVADNCTDGTADRARAAGATVLERHDSERTGKGFALEWAFDRLPTEPGPADAVVVVDADCAVSANMLAAVDQRLRRGEAALQVRYVVANPDESRSSALRFAAFALVNTVRPLGRSTLGFSAGLLGTGMVFSSATLARHPWRAHTIVEDAEYHLQLVTSGERVIFVPEAEVRSAMPTSFEAARDQNLRWESGKWILAGRWTPRLIRRAIRHREVSSVQAALELLIPGQSLLLAANGCTLAFAVARRVAVRLASINILGQLVYIVGGLAVARAPASAYRALLSGPLLAVWKLGLYVRLLSGRGPRDWVKTERAPEAGAEGSRVAVGSAG